MIFGSDLEISKKYYFKGVLWKLLFMFLVFGFSRL